MGFATQSIAHASPSQKPKATAVSRDSVLRVEKLTGRVMWVNGAQKASILKTESVIHPGESIQTTRTSTAEVVGDGWRVKLAPHSHLSFDKPDKKSKRKTLRLTYGAFYVDAELGSDLNFAVGSSRQNDFTIQSPSTKVLVVAVEDGARFQALQGGEALDIPPTLVARFLRWAVRSGEIRRGEHRLVEGDAYGVVDGQADQFPTHPGPDPVRALIRSFSF